MKQSLVEVYARSRPGLVATSLAGYQLDELIEFLSSLETDVAASVLSRLSSAKAISVLTAMSHEQVGILIDAANHDDELRIISYLPTMRYPEIVEAAAQADEIKAKLYGYSEGSLGAIASPEFIAIEKGKSVAEARKELDFENAKVDVPVFVVHENKLLGRLPLIPLLSRSRKGLPVEKLMIDSEWLSGSANVQVALTTTQWGENSVLPVVDGHQCLIGVVSRQQLEVAGELSELPVFGAEQIISELASGYFMTCAGLLDVLVGGRK